MCVRERVGERERERGRERESHDSLDDFHYGPDHSITRASHFDPRAASQ